MSNKLEQAEQEFILKLQATKTGLKNTEITEFTSTLTDDERAQLVNKILQSGNAEILTITGTDGWILRYRKSNLPAGSTPEEQVVCFF
jgi:hypothetical protein